MFEEDLRAREIVLLRFTSVYTYVIECGFRGSAALTMTIHHLCFIAAVPNLFDLWTLKMKQCLPGTALDKSGEQINQRLIFFSPPLLRMKGRITAELMYLSKKGE